MWLWLHIWIVLQFPMEHCFSLSFLCCCPQRKIRKANLSERGKRLIWVNLRLKILLCTESPFIKTTSKLSEKDAFYEERSYPNTISKNLSKPGRTTSFWNGLYSKWVSKLTIVKSHNKIVAFIKGTSDIFKCFAFSF